MGEGYLCDLHSFFFFFFLPLLQSEGNESFFVFICIKVLRISYLFVKLLDIIIC